MIWSEQETTVGRLPGPGPAAATDTNYSIATGRGDSLIGKME